EVQDVEEAADAGGVHGILSVDGDPLGVEVLLREIAGEGSDNADGECNNPNHPGRRTTLPPARHEVLSPEMQDHEDEEHLHAPEMEAVEEPAGEQEVSPQRAEGRTEAAVQDDPGERGNRHDRI